MTHASNKTKYLTHMYPICLHFSYSDLSVLNKYYESFLLHNFHYFSEQNIKFHPKTTVMRTSTYRSFLQRRHKYNPHKTCFISLRALFTQNTLHIFILKGYLKITYSDDKY